MFRGDGAADAFHERIDYITRFVLENPELIKLWIEDLISAGDIRSRYPRWDTLVKGIAAAPARGQVIDAEVYSVILLTSAIIGPRVFKNSVSPGMDTETIVRRFRVERQRLLKHDALLRASPPRDGNAAKPTRKARR